MFATAGHTQRFTPMLILLLFIAVALAGCSLEVQPIEQFTSVDGNISMAYPAEMDVLMDAVDHGIASIMLGTHPDLVELNTMPAGESGLAVMVMPDRIPIGGGESQQITAQEFSEMVRDSAVEQEDFVTELTAIETAEYPEVF